MMVNTQWCRLGNIHGFFNPTDQDRLLLKQQYRQVGPRHQKKMKCALLEQLSS